jgi:hypothetical protein
MSNEMTRLSYLEISGTPQAAGEAMGRFGAFAVHEHLKHTRAWSDAMQWRGASQVKVMERLVRERLPRVWLELEGLAKGIGLPVDDVFLWNCRGDLSSMSTDGCSTVQLPGSASRRIVHNEDGDPGLAGHCAIADLHIAGSPSIISFIYPGSLIGHTFAVTGAGLAMTVNNLRLLNVEPGVPRMALTRAILDRRNPGAALQLLEDHPRAGGFHLTLAGCDDSDLISVEFGSAACSVVTISAPSFHSNHAIHPAIRGTPQRITGSSGHRQVRGEALVRAHADPLQILSDADNRRFPIHRSDPNDEDDENTLATADIQVTSARIDLAIHEHPSRPARFRLTPQKNAGTTP